MTSQDRVSGMGSHRYSIRLIEYCATPENNFLLSLAICDMATTKSNNDLTMSSDSLTYSSSSHESDFKCSCLCPKKRVTGNARPAEYVSPTSSEGSDWKLVQRKERQKCSPLPQIFGEQKLQFSQESVMNAHLLELEKESRRDSFARKLRDYKRGLDHQNGIMSVVDDIKSVGENIGTLMELSRSLSKLKTLMAYDSTERNNLFDNICARIEDLTALCVALVHSENWQTTLSVIHLYLRTFCPKSFIKVVLELIGACFGASVFETQAGFEIGNVADYISGFKEAVSNWNQFRHSSLAKNVANMIDILATFGIVSCTQVIDEKVVKKLNIFRDPESKKFTIKAWNLQRESVDFVSMALETVVFFIERGYSAIVLRDPLALLYTDSEIMKLDSEFALLTTAMPLIEAGRLDELSTPESVRAFKVPPILDEADFDIRLEKLIMTVTKLISMESNPACKNALSQKLTVLARTRTSYVLYQKREPMRIKPFGLMIFGRSSVGKSHIVAALVQSVLHANGFAHSREHIVTMNDLDKYDSEYTSKHTAVIFDDYGNAVPSTYDVAPTKKIIDYLNNIPLTAVKADLASKGNVMIKPKVVALTTNVKTLLANVFSNEPVSVMRRLDVVVEARLKPEYVDRETGGPLREKMCTDIIPDAWEICLQRVKICRGKMCDTYEFVDLMTGKELSHDFRGTWVDFYDAQQLVVSLSKTHFDSQRQFLANVGRMYDTEMCVHSWPGGAQTCRLCCVDRAVKANPPLQDESCEDHTKRVITSMLGLEIHGGSDADGDDWHSLPSVVQPSFMRLVAREPEPGEPYEYDHAGRISLLRNRRDIAEDSLRECMGKFMNPPVVEGDPDEVESFTFTRYFREHSQQIMCGCAVLLTISAVVAVALGVYKTMAKPLGGQSGVVAQPVILETDVPNPWKQVNVVSIPCTLESRTATTEQICALLARRIGYAKVRKAGTDEPRKVCDIVPLCNNYWILPGHMLPEDVQWEIEVIFKNHNELGRHIKQNIIPADWVKIPDSDYAVVKLVTGGDNIDIRKFFPLEPPALSTHMRLLCDTVWKGPDGDVERSVIPVTSLQEVKVADMTYQAYLYHCTKPTFKGMCMMALVTHSKQPVILGFHLSGLTGQTQGAAGVIHHTFFDEAIAELANRTSFTCHSGGEAKVTVVGELCDQPINPHHSVHFLTQDDDGREPCIEVWGPHVKGGVRFRSNIRKSIISDSVTTHLDLPKMHGPPNTKCINKHWQRDLQTIACPRTMYDRYVLQLAMDDMWSKWNSFIESDIDFDKIVHPYDWDTVYAGVDGVTSVDAVDLNTSMGWPINKGKKNFFTPSDRDIEHLTRPLDLDPEIHAHVLELEDELRSGRRIYTVFRACLKDEAKKLDSKKIRIFAGCSTPFLLLCRKYMLSVIRYMQTNWLQFECAVGINAHGREWDTLAQYLQQFGGAKCIAGDYSSYDKTFSPMCLEAVYELWSRMCRKAGYTDEQMRVVNGLITELMYPVYEWDGVLIQSFASNPSGHFGTVHVNGHANGGPFLRYSYFAHAVRMLNPTREVWQPISEIPQAQFASFNALVTYGDDFVDEVSPLEPYGFNFLVAQRELADIGMVLTEEDKGEHESKPFKSLHDVTFLKRRFARREDLGNMYVAPLDEISIAKSLHNYMHRKKSPALPDEIAAQSIQGALREWFRYPPDYFEKRRSELLKVIEENGLNDLVGHLPTYQEYRTLLLDGPVRCDPTELVLEQQMGNSPRAGLKCVPLPVANLAHY